MMVIFSMPAPALAQEPLIEVSGLKLPSGVAVAGDPFTYYDDAADATMLCLVFSYGGAATNLFFHDLAVNGKQLVADSFIGRQVTEIPSDVPDGQPMCIPAAAGDISLGAQAQMLSLTSTAAATMVSAKSDIAFPGAYDAVATKLNTLGFDTTDAYFSWNQQADGSVSYDFYVDIAPQADISESPVTLSITSASMTTGSGAIHALAGGDRFRIISTDDEIWLGSTKIDPEVGLGKVQVRADIGKVLPSTVKSNAKLPTGLRISAAPDQWYFDDEGGTTDVGPFILANSTSKAMNIALSGAVLKASTGGNDVDLKLKSASVQYLTVPAKGTAELHPFVSPYVGDLRFGYGLTLGLAVAAVTPSVLDVKALKITKGYEVQPLSFDLLTYDPATKTTNATVLLSQPANTPDRALIFSGGAANGKSLKTAVVAGAVRREGGTGVRQFHIALGSFKGDIRLGKKLVLSGNVVAVTRTKYTNTAEVDDDSVLVYVAALTSPEMWSFDAVKRSTAITVTFTNDDDTSAVIGFCTLSVTVAGKKLTAAKLNATVRPGTDTRAVIAVGPGDLRYGGAQVTVTGTYKYGGC